MFNKRKNFDNSFKLCIKNSTEFSNILRLSASSSFSTAKLTFNEGPIKK